MFGYSSRFSRSCFAFADFLTIFAEENRDY